MSYVRKTRRPYRHLTADQERQGIEWVHARRKLGNQKEFAARLGIGEHQVQVIASKIRNGDPLGLVAGKEGKANG